MEYSLAAQWKERRRSRTQDDLGRGIAWRHGLATLAARWPTRSQSVRHYHQSPPLGDQGHFWESLDIELGVENEMKPL